MNKQHATVSARDVVVGDAPPWTSAQVRQLGARHAFAVGRPHFEIFPTPFRICSITEPNLPTAGHALQAQHAGGVTFSVPGTGRCDDDPHTFGPLPGLLTYGTLAARADSARKLARGGPDVWGGAAAALSRGEAVARVRSVAHRFEYAVIRPGPTPRGAPHGRDRATAALVEAACKGDPEHPGRTELFEAELLAAVAAGHESEAAAFMGLAEIDPLASGILRCERLEGEYAPANNHPRWGGGRDVIERIIGLCASVANAHVDGVSAQEGLGLGSGWCDVALGACAPATAGPAVGSAASGGRAEYATESAVCSVTGEPVMRTIAHAKASGN